MQQHVQSEVHLQHVCLKRISDLLVLDSFFCLCWMGWIQKVEVVYLLGVD